MLIEYTLKLLQYFCEGHYEPLQNYLREQTVSKVNYDIISLIISLLIAHKISIKTSSAISQCFDTLTECVQGPCKKNQRLIVMSKFIDYAVNVIKEDPRVFELDDKRIIQYEE